jgi:hypothetical protein
MLAAKLAGASRDELERFHRKASSRTSPAVKLNRYKIPLGMGTTITLAGQNLTIDDAIEKFDLALKAAKKARDEGLDGKTWAKVMQQKSKNQIGG